MGKRGNRDIGSVLGLTDRRPPRLMLGRDAELQRLLQQEAIQGVTLLSGRPQIGKSRLLEELRDLMIQNRTLVGFCESSGQEADLLLRSVADAYGRWLEGATWREQAESLTHRYRSEATTLGLRFLSRMIGKTSGFNVADELLSVLWSVEDNLRSPLQSLKRLSYGQAEELVRTLFEVSSQPIALILDGFEQSPDLDAEVKSIEAILRHRHAWPERFHIFVGVRSTSTDSSLQDAINSLRAFPGTTIIEIGSIDFDGHPSDRGRLLSLIREWVPAAREQSDEDILQVLDGYPGTLDRWLFSRPSTVDELHRVADDAQRYRYPEFDVLLPRVCQDQKHRALAVGLALMPELTSVDAWERFRPILLNDADAVAVLDLQSNGVLDQEVLAYPSFGHTTRYRAAQEWFLTAREARPFARQEAQRLVLQLCDRVRHLRPDESWFGAALSDLGPRIARLPDLEEYQAPGRACMGLLNEEYWADAGEWQQSLCAFARIHREAAALAAAVLMNLQRYAKSRGELAWRNEMLDELRQLAKDYPEDLGVRESLAMALHNARIDAWTERHLLVRDALLDEMRELAARNPTDATVRARLAYALGNTLLETKAEGDLKRPDALLAELRQLVQNHPADAIIGERLAIALLDGLNDAKSRNDMPRCNALLDELRALVQSYTADVGVRNQLSMALFNMLNHANAMGNVANRDALLAELRHLTRMNPTDVDVRRQFAMGLFNTMNTVSNEESLGNFAQRHKLLDELRDLVRQYADDSHARHRLGKALNNLLFDTTSRGLAMADAIIEELEQMSRIDSDDRTSRELLANALLTASVRYAANGDLFRYREALERLRRLAQACRGETGVRKAFGAALFNEAVAAHLSSQFDERDAHFDELRQLADINPGDSYLQGLLTECAQRCGVSL